MRLREALALAALTASCRAPSYTPGGLLCANGPRPCPDGYHCAAGRCFGPGEDPDGGASPDLGSTSGDGGAPDLAAVDAASACGWEALPPSNFAPCKLSAPVTWIAESSQYDTATGTGGGGPVGALVAQTTGGPMVRLVRVDSFVVPGGVALKIAGPYPLVIAADTVDVTGSIHTFAGQDPAGLCGYRPGSPSTYCGGGGGGGGFGGMGGTGGGCGGGGPTTAAPTMGTATLTPLVGGCSGSSGGNPGKTAIVGGGGGGGALQISARISITVAGVIDAGGGGGSAGGADTSCAGAACSSGGGGGGSGGAILLEAPMMKISGSLCANGGGGGGGGQNGLAASATSGAAATCVNLAASGGGGLGMGGKGGTGSAAPQPSGGAGNPGGNQDGGGGGGGGVGRIRIRASNASPLQQGSLVTPMAAVN